MRRIVVVATALAVLIAAASAFAATGGINTYTATLKVSPNKAGSHKSPSATGFLQKYAANGTGGNRTAPLTNIKTTIYGLVSDGKDFPTCSAGKIINAGNDKVCPKGALVASGSITALLGPATDQSASNPQIVPCDPLLDVWNAGQGKIVFFFVETATHTCGPIQTGGVPPYPGTIKTVGKNLVQNTPIPNYVSFPITGVEGSLTSLTLHWKNLSTKLKNGKTVHYATSVACKGGKRPYSEQFTAETSEGGTPSSGTVTGTQKCS
ncbi:MAG TPA: hypothetical protein VMJ65_03800 [Solirubrobacteraceae bacterium]|nr:hypothetical protein [Solirubrobacteraceae bacterium]